MGSAAVAGPSVERASSPTAGMAYRRWRHRLLYNQRGPILAAALRARTDAIIATLAVRLD